MKRHISIFTFLLGAFAAGLASEAGAATTQTVNGGYYWYEEEWQNDRSTERMFVEGNPLTFTATIPEGDEVTFVAVPPPAMVVSGWGIATTSIDVQRIKDWTDAASLSNPSNYPWTGKPSEGNRYLVVKFKYMPLDITFNGGDGGSGKMDQMTKLNIDSEFTLPANEFTKTGYHFSGWKTNETKGVVFEDKATRKGSAFWNGKSFDSTLYAQWAPNTYAVWSAGENCTVLVAASAAYDGDLTINWTPDGAWRRPTVTVYAGTDDKGTAIKTYPNLSEGTTSVTFKMSDLKAYYENIFVKVSYEVHTLTFDPNGGTCEEKSRRVERGSLIGELPKATQYQRTQKGWWDDPGAGNAITAATVYDFPGDITAYAHWEKAELFNIDTVADPEEGGTLTGGGQYAKDEQITLTATPSNGYSFVKWTAKTSGEEHTDPTWPITVIAGDLYTAYFTGNVYKVTFMAPEGTPIKQERFVTFGSEYGDLPTATWTEDESDMGFAGWNTDPDGEGDMVFSNTVVSIAGKQTLYAMWKPIPVYHIAYNGNGSTSGSMQNQKMYCGVADNLTSNKYERIGYHFRGWATNTADAAALKIAYADGERVTDIASTNETATLYAAWEAITLSEAMHCNDPSLVWNSEQYYPTSVNEWTPEVGANIGYDGDSCVRQMGAGGNLGMQQWLQTQVSTNGHFSFKWKPSGEKGEISVAIMNNANPPGKNDYKLIPCISSEWQTYEIDIPKGYYMKIANSGASSCSIDQMTWTPGGPEPVDGKDNVTISSAAVSDGKFKLSFESKAEFAYNLLTNANLLIDSWGVMTNVVGTGGTMYFEPQIIEGQPQMFYRVDTIQKK